MMDEFLGAYRGVWGTLEGSFQDFVSHLCFVLCAKYVDEWGLHEGGIFACSYLGFIHLQKDRFDLFTLGGFNAIVTDFGNCSGTQFS